MSIPEAPTNVRVVDQDGTEHPVECRYRDTDENGTNHWVVTSSWQGIPLGVRFDRIPPKTAISLEFEP